MVRRHRERSNDNTINGIDGIEEIEYGLRRSRRNTSWEYRDSSSLSPAQRMEQELYYHVAEDCLDLSISILLKISLFSIISTGWEKITDLWSYNFQYRQTYLMMQKSHKPKCKMLWKKCYFSIHGLRVLENWLCFMLKISQYLFDFTISSYHKNIVTFMK